LSVPLIEIDSSSDVESAEGRREVSMRVSSDISRMVMNLQAHVLSRKSILPRGRIIL
jgi:hypothetical protein